MYILKIEKLRMNYKFIKVRLYKKDHIIIKMGALTLNIKNLHSGVGTTDLIEIDETRFPTII